MGLGFILTILYVFVIAPKRTMSTLGSADLKLDFPVQKWNIRYSEEGILPFCSNDNTSLTIQVADNTTVYSASDGIVVGVEDNIVRVEVLPRVYVEYYPVSNFSVFKGDYITKGDSIGKVANTTFSLRIDNAKMELYECPYTFLNDFGKSIIDDAMSTTGYAGNVCKCASLSY